MDYDLKLCLNKNKLYYRIIQYKLICRLLGLPFKTNSSKYIYSNDHDKCWGECWACELWMYGLFTMHNDSLSNAHTFPSVKHLISTLIGPSVKHYSNTFHVSPMWVSNQLLNHDQLKQYVRFLKFKSQVLSVLQ